MRRVRGVLFRDYVRMLRVVKHPELRASLQTDDIALLDSKIDPEAWYPMETFERFGNAILKYVCRNELFPVQLWGRYSAQPLVGLYAGLVIAGNPRETLERFRGLRPSFFTFDAIEVTSVLDGTADVQIAYHMGASAEEAASHQTMGFFEGLLQLAGAKDIEARFVKRSWAGDDMTLVSLRWRR
jgi:hypothetical protein